MKANPYKFLSFFLLAILLLNCDNDDTNVADPCCDSTAPPMSIIIPRATSLQYESDYLNNQFRWINENLLNEYPESGQNQGEPGADATGFIPDDREYWYDLEEFKQYICYVEEVASTQGYDNLGLRFYLGSKVDLDTDNAPRTVLFFTPTFRENDPTNPNDPDEGGENFPGSDGADGNLGLTRRPGGGI